MDAVLLILAFYRVIKIDWYFSSSLNDFLSCDCSAGTV